MKKAIRFVQDIGALGIGFGFFGVVGNLDNDINVMPAVILMLIGIFVYVLTEILDKLIYSETDPDVIEMTKRKRA